jgi:hypothetical protein
MKRFDPIEPRVGVLRHDEFGKRHPTADCDDVVPYPSQVLAGSGWMDGVNLDKEGARRFAGACASVWAPLLSDHAFRESREGSFCGTAF